LWADNRHSHTQSVGLCENYERSPTPFRSIAAELFPSAERDCIFLANHLGKRQVLWGMVPGACDPVGSPFAPDKPDYHVLSSPGAAVTGLVLAGLSADEV